MSQPIKRLLLVAALISLFLPLVLANNVQSASANGWPKPQTDIAATHLLSHPDGSLTASSCYGADTRQMTLRSYGPTGSELSSVSNQSDGSAAANACDLTVATDAAGTTYSVVTTQSGVLSFVAYSLSGASPWPPVEVLSDCGNSVVSGMAVGLDRDLYALATSYCSGRSYLVGISRETGIRKFEVQLDGNAVDYGSLIAAYNDGLIVRMHTTLAYYSYSGIQDASKTYTFTLGANQGTRNMSVTVEGKVFLSIFETGRWNATDSCTITDQAIVKSVIEYGLDGVDRTYDLTGACLLDAQIGATPSGGAVLSSGQPLSDGSYQNSLVYISPAGNVTNVPMSSPPGAVAHPATAQVDLHGNVLTTSYFYESANDADRHVLFRLFGKDGVQLARWSTAALDRPDTHDQFRVHYGPAQASGVLYALLSNDQVNESLEIHRIPFAEVGFDYPRGAILGIPSNPVEELEYVALGDSFSSGEGVEPFISPSDTNGCHRSSHAYPNVLSEAPDINWSLKAFRACSGATTETVMQGKSGEPGQLDSLSDYTDIVTITVGGNDVGFTPFVKKCLTGYDAYFGCTAGSQEYDYAFQQLSLLPDLLVNPSPSPSQSTGVFTALSAKAPNADVYVLGYPHVVPLSTEGEDPGTCLLIDDTEKVAARSLVTGLNNTLRDAVAEMNGAQGGATFYYVDPEIPSSPFYRKEICQDGTYFNGAMWPDEYSYHPNQLGQQAYASLLMQNL